MTPQAYEILDLVTRWVHVIAAIMWVGNSLLFNWLDRILTPSSKGGEGMQGETWLIHSGGFYFLEKTQLVGQQLPRPLHWFKWQAYATWISGAWLLVFVYYAGGRAALVGGGHPELSHATAVVIAAGAIVASWALYEFLWRFVVRRSSLAAIVLSILAIVALVVGLTHLLNGRAAFLHVGAAFGTMMAGNVAMTIVPSQRALVARVEKGGGSDLEIAERAKTRSIHNNYLTFPVIALMLISHFPAVYGHPWNWALLLVILVGGAMVRHLLNIRFTFTRWEPALYATIAATAAALYLPVRYLSGRAERPSVARLVTYDDAQRVIDRRCSACHSAQPSDVSFGVMPGGVAFDTRQQIEALAPRILERAVNTRTMPPANKTRMTDDERAVLHAWITGRIDDPTPRPQVPR